MPETKTYELYLSLVFKTFVFGMLGLFLIVGIIFIVVGILLFTDSNVPFLFMGIFMTIMGGWNFYWIFSFPHRITISDTGEISFISLLRLKQTHITEIESVKPDPSQFFGFLVIRTQNKKIKILNQFDGFHDFIINLKSKKPSIEIRGC